MRMETTAANIVFASIPGGGHRRGNRRERTRFRRPDDKQGADPRHGQYGLRQRFGPAGDAQITTAREQALLGRAIQEQFPEYCGYFAIPSFKYHGVAISNHNTLLQKMQGADGIKRRRVITWSHQCAATRHLIGVVLGERSNSARDARMRQLIENQFREARPTRTAPSIVPCHAGSLLAAKKLVGTASFGDRRWLFGARGVGRGSKWRYNRKRLTGSNFRTR
jgi:hypothetical protein